MQEDFREQVEDWEEFQELTVSQRERLLASSDFYPAPSCTVKKQFCLSGDLLGSGA